MWNKLHATNTDRNRQALETSHNTKCSKVLTIRTAKTDDNRGKETTKLAGCSYGNRILHERNVGNPTTMSTSYML